MKTNMDAYRYFFPAGWALGLWGVLLWVLFPAGIISYPGLWHPDVMMGGFFMCFVCGFLMTASPRFTGTFGPTLWEQRTALALIGILVLASVWFAKVSFYAVVVVMFVFLARFVMVRFRQRKSQPPDSFVFLGFGLAAGLFSAVVLFLGEIVSIPFALRNLARLFFMQAYIMCLVVGVGSRLVPALLGFAPLPTEQARFTQPTLKVFTCLGVVFIASYFLESLVSEWGGYLLRSLLLSYLFLAVWKIYRYPQRRGVQTFWLWGSAWSILLGHWAVVFFVSYRIHILHVILVSGLALMTLMIAVRVSLSHGAHNMMLEKNSKPLAVGGFLICLAGLTRLSAGFTPAIYQSHLLYAALTWIVGMIVWGVIFIPKMLKTNNSAES